MHEKNDGFPLLYVRSHAARLPGSVVRDWLVRCKVALAASQGRLVLKVRGWLTEWNACSITCGSVGLLQQGTFESAAWHYYGGVSLLPRQPLRSWCRIPLLPACDSEIPHCCCGPMLSLFPHPCRSFTATTASR